MYAKILRRLFLGLTLSIVGLGAIAQAERTAPITLKGVSLRQKLFGVPHAQPVKDILKAAGKTGLVADHNRMILDFAGRNVETLPMHSVLKLAKTTLTYDAHDSVLKTYATANASRLTVPEVIKLAKGATMHATHNEILTQYANQHRTRLSELDLATLGQATTTYPAEHAVLRGAPAAGPKQ